MVKGIDLLDGNPSDVYLGSSSPIEWLSVQMLESHCPHCLVFLVTLDTWLNFPMSHSPVTGLL